MSVFATPKILAELVFNLLLNFYLDVLSGFRCRWICLYLNGLKGLKKPPGMFLSFWCIFVFLYSLLRGLFVHEKICVIKLNYKNCRSVNSTQSLIFAGAFLTCS